MANIQVNYQQIQATSGWIHQLHETMNQQLNQLKGKINELTESGYRSDLASPAFKEATDQWTKGAATMFEGMTKMENFLNEVGSGHHDLDARLKGQSQV